MRDLIGTFDEKLADVFKLYIKDIAARKKYRCACIIDYNYGTRVCMSKMHARKLDALEDAANQSTWNALCKSIECEELFFDK